METRDRLERILDAFPGVKVAVVGDLIADLFVYGQTSRVSREAPVLVLDYQSERLALGGAANAAHSVRALGAVPLAIGLIGPDAQGAAVTEAMEERGIDTRRVLEVPDRPTTSKTRFAGSSLHTTFQQMLRIDRGRRDEPAPATQNRLLTALDEAVLQTDVLIVSDYGYGVLGSAVVSRVNELAAAGRVKVMLDSRYRLTSFRSAFTMTPNEPEAQEASGIALTDDEAVRAAGRKLRHDLEAWRVLITRGRRGMALFDENGVETFIPIFGSDEIADVTGAGDTVIATYSVAVAAGASAIEAAILANVAGGLVVMKSGTATVSADEIRAAIRKEAPWPKS